MEEKNIKFYKTFHKKFKNDKNLILCSNTLSNRRMKFFKKIIFLCLIILLTTGCASTALGITGGKIISHDFKIYHFSDDDYLDIFNLKNGERITKFCTKHEEQVEVRKMRKYHDGVDRTIWIVDIVETVE